LLFQGENVADHLLRVGLGYFGMRRHVPRPGAMAAFSHSSGKNRDCLRLAPVPGGDIDERRSGIRLIVRVAEITLVLLQHHWSLGPGNARRRHDNGESQAPTFGVGTERVDRSLTTGQVAVSSLIRRRSGLPMALFGNGVSRN